MKILDNSKVYTLEICLVILILFYGKYFLKQEQNLLVQTISSIFIKTIQTEKALFAQIVYNHYENSSSSNKIPKEEKENWCIQRYFIKKDPNRTHLDSIFNAELTKEGILGKGVIYCTYRNKETCSSPDTLF